MHERLYLLFFITIVAIFTSRVTTMAFQSASSSTNAGLVQNLRTVGAVHSDAVANAMLRTDRAKYMAQVETPDGGPIGELASYADSPHPIGYGQTISAPHMVRVCELLS